MRVLGIIPARGGSKGIPRKNIRPLGGRPLLQYTAEAALGARRLADVVLTTDDPEIAELGRRLGLRIPFLRPAELARDDTPSLPVLRHTVSLLEEQGETYDAICLLEPTSPMRLPEDVDACIDRLVESGADAVMTVLPVPVQYNPHWVYLMAEDGALRVSTGDPEPVPRRQELPPAFNRDGMVYVTRRNVLMEQNSLYGRRTLGIVIDPDRSVNIDSPDDWARAERLLAARSERGDVLESVTQPTSAL